MPAQPERHERKPLPIEQMGNEIYGLVERLYPVCRSITGAGVRETLAAIGEYVDLEIHEVPTGTAVFDWEIPREWAIRDAFIADEAGNRIVDFRSSNLHVVSYSCPVDVELPLSELAEHLHTDPEHPDWIPYRTSYYSEDWGFCLTQNQLDGLEDGRYRAFIDSELFDGSLSYGEFCIPGDTDEEILFFAHCCHPSLCNDNLSGLAMLAVLARQLSGQPLRHTLRFIFAPATIGSITWLALNEDKLDRVRGGLVASVLGDSGRFRYKESAQGDATIDRVCRHVLDQTGADHELLPFSPWGYDERQFCSPGIDLPVGRLTRSPNGEYPEYHTSADDLDLVAPEFLGESLRLYHDVVSCLEADRTYINNSPNCEPQLGRRGLYRKMGGFQDIEETKLAMLWMLNQSNGNRSLLDIADKSGLSWKTLDAAAQLLVEHDLLEAAPGAPTGAD